MRGAFFALRLAMVVEAMDRTARWRQATDLAIAVTGFVTADTVHQTTVAMLPSAAAHAARALAASGRHSPRVIAARVIPHPAGRENFSRRLSFLPAPRRTDLRSRLQDRCAASPAAGLLRAVPAS